MLDSINTNRAAPKMLAMLLIAVLAVSVFIGPAAAGDAPATGDIDAQNFLCDDGETESSAFVSFLSFIMGFFFIASFALGIVSFAGDKLGTAAGSFSIPIVDDMDGDTAVKAGFGLPIGVWGITFIGNSFFGYDLTCIIPLQ